jgi:hypothetical protein
MANAPLHRMLHLVPGMLRARYAVSVAIITSAALGRRRSSRPVSYAVGPVGFHFSPTERRANAMRISPACILDPLWCSRGRTHVDQRHPRQPYKQQLHGGALLLIDGARDRLVYQLMMLLPNPRRQVKWEAPDGLMPPVPFGMYLLQQMTLAAIFSWWLAPLVTRPGLHGTTTDTSATGNARNSFSDGTTTGTSATSQNLRQPRKLPRNRSESTKQSTRVNSHNKRKYAHTRQTQVVKSRPFPLFQLFRD